MFACNQTFSEPCLNFRNDPELNKLMHTYISVAAEMNDDVETFINAWFYFFDSILDPAFAVFITSWEFWDLMHFGERNTHCFCLG